MIGMKSTSHYSNIKKITKLRNSCAHNDAKYLENDGQNIKSIIELIEKYPDFLKKMENRSYLWGLVKHDLELIQRVSF